MKRKASFYTESDYYSDSDEDSLSGEHLDTTVPPLPPIMSASDANFLTPHRATAGGAQMGVVNTSANHQHLHQELSGKVAYDDPAVFKRLRVFDEDAASIARCQKDYQTEMKGNIAELVRIANEASREGARVVPEGNAAGKRKRKQAIKEQEQLMYTPLDEIFAFLSTWGDSNGADARRDFKQSSSITMSPPVNAAEAYTPATSSMRPDFCLLSDNPNRASWHTCDAFAEIKAAEEESNRPENPKHVMSAVLQCADYARYHMAFRPFWIFSVILLITGTTFRVAIVDHEGVILSSLHSLVNDEYISEKRRGSGAIGNGAEIFVRVVRVLTRLSDYELGHDPSVATVTPSQLSDYLQQSTLTDAHRRQISLAGSPSYYPSYRIEPFGNVKRTWCTVGPPIWVSMSLCGRGTQVWRVLELEPVHGQCAFVGEFRVLKSAWRDTRKVAEMEVHTLISKFRHEEEAAVAKKRESEGGLIPAPASSGIVRSLYGSDVFYHFDPQTWSQLSIAHIRRFSGPEEPTLPDPLTKTLHRIILETFGEPLWTYRDELELLEAFYAIVEAHRFLCQRGIVHRDLSPGNVLLWRGGPVKGFITDFDMAHVDNTLIGHITVQRAVNPIQKGFNPSSGMPVMTPGSVSTKVDFTLPRPRGYPMTGTLQFMAHALLEAIDSETPLKHTLVHDLESIIYVLGYTVLRRLVSSAGCPRTLEDFFKDCFGKETVKDIAYLRETCKPLSWCYKHDDPYIMKHTSIVMSDLFQDLANAVKAVHEQDAKKRYQDIRAKRLVMLGKSPDSVPAATPPTPALTHDMILTLLGRAINTFKEKPELIIRFDPDQVLKPLPTNTGSSKTKRARRE